MLGRKTKAKYQELEKKFEIQSNKYDALMSSFTSLQYETFDGEKQAGELGTPIDLFPDYYGARQRAWELQLTNDVAKLTINKWVSWVVGKGLRFNAALPKEEYLQNVDREQLTKDIEFRFRNYLQSKFSDFSAMENVHSKAKIASYNSLVSGDILVVLRVKNGNVTNQLIDGANLATPIDYDFENSNEILDGVEYDSEGKHVAFWVYTSALKFERVAAIDPITGLKMAFLVYGSKFRLNETRGLQLMIENYEKLKNLERFVDATVKNAQLSNELVYINEHDATSTGVDVFKDAAMRAATQTVSNNFVKRDDLPTSKCFEKNLAKNTKGTVLNNTIGAQIKMLKPDAEKSMPDFLEANLKLVFASAGIPFEVAMSVYNSNYSASRAAIKDWEHNLKVKRSEFEDQFYKPIYELWLYNEVLTGRIKFEQLIDAYINKDYVYMNALNKSTFTGANVPSIDPLKEVNAIRKSLGDEETALITYEMGSETVGQIDFSEVQQQVAAERKIIAKSLPKEEKNES